MELVIDGQRQALEQAMRLEQAAHEAGQWRVEVVSDEPYFWPIETGRYRTGPRAGRVARKAGGAWMARRAYDQIGPTVPGQLVAAMQREMHGEHGAVVRAEDASGRKLAETTSRYTPRRSGRLAGSTYAKAGSRTIRRAG